MPAPPNLFPAVETRKRQKYIRAWIVSALTIPALLDFFFFESSLARYARVSIVLIILFSALNNYELFFKTNAIGVGTILLVVGLYLIGTFSALAHGGVATPNIATLIVILFLASLNFDQYRYFLDSVGVSLMILTSISVVAIFLKLNPRNFYLSSDGYPVLANYIGIPGRNLGVFAHPNSLGQASALVFIYLLNTNRSKFWLLVPVFCIMKCGSRTSLVIMILVALFHFFNEIRSSDKILRKSKESYPFVTTFFLVLMFSAIAAVSINYVGILSPDDLTGRVSIWQAALEIYKGNTVTGIGWGWEDRAIDSQLLNVWAVSAHNAVLEIIISAGVIGLVSFLVLISKPLSHISNLLGMERMFLTSILVSGISESFIDLQYPNITTYLVLLITLTCHRKRVGNEQ